MPIRLSGKEIIKALAKDGWAVERVSGSDQIMRRFAGRHVTIPVHGDKPLPAGTLSAICREAGRTAQQLRDLL